MFGIGRNQKVSKAAWGKLDAHGLNLLKTLWAAHDAGRIYRGWTHATGFVISCARSSAFAYLADKGAPFRNIKESHLASDTALYEFYDYLTLAFFFALYKRLGTDEWLGIRLEIKPDQLVPLVEFYSGVKAVMLSTLKEMDSEISLVDEISRDLGTNISEGMPDPKGKAIESLLGAARTSLCGQMSGLSSFHKYLPKKFESSGLSNLDVIVFFNGMFQHVFDDQYKRLKEHY